MYCHVIPSNHLKSDSDRYDRIICEVRQQLFQHQCFEALFFNIPISCGPLCLEMNLAINFLYLSSSLTRIGRLLLFLSLMSRWLLLDDLYLQISLITELILLQFQHLEHSDL